MHDVVIPMIKKSDQILIKTRKEMLKKAKIYLKDALDTIYKKSDDYFSSVRKEINIELNSAYKSMYIILSEI